MINPKHGLPYHEWWIEFEERNVELNVFSEAVDKKLQEKNIYYKDLIKGKVLKSLEIREVKRGGFNRHMKSAGKPVSYTHLTLPTKA